jgi:hypothetical protein
MKRVLVLVVVGLFVLWVGPALAADEAVIGEIQTEVSVTKSKAEANAAEIQSLKGGLPAEEAARQAADNVLHTATDLNNDAISTLKTKLNVEIQDRITADAGLDARIFAVEAYESRIAALEGQLSAALDLIVDLQNAVAAIDPSGELVELADHVTVSDSTINGLAGPHVIFHDANVHVRSGVGLTGGLNGLGNLIVGYNETESADINNRTGSHNLIVGTGHEFTSIGGMVAGRSNRIMAGYGSITGGMENEIGVNGSNASVSGGRYNTANSNHASVSGGWYNTASAAYASVSGGMGNTANGLAASVSGGRDNIASNESASVSGGSGNEARGQWSSVSGGYANSASGPFSSVSGGTDNSASDGYASVSGGGGNTAGGQYASVSGGVSNMATGNRSSISGGFGNLASGDFYATVSGGSNNVASGQWYATVSGGYANSAIHNYSTVSGGKSQTTVADYDHKP